MQRIWNFRKFQFLELGFDHESNHKFTLLAVNMTWNLTITRLTWTNSLNVFQSISVKNFTRHDGPSLMGVIQNFRRKKSIMSLFENFLNDENQQEK